jgi:RHS repeat-associated protein
MENGGVVFDEQYVHDDAGRITSRTETFSGTSTTIGYSYDAAGHLASVSRDGTQIAAYSYNENGSRLAKTMPGATYSATYDDQDRLLTFGGTTYSYTANGELLAKTDMNGTTSYTYDAFGNLRTVVLPGGTRIEYIIDGQNRRVGKKVNGTLVQGWLYGDQLRIVAELDGTGAIVSQFVYGTHTNVPDYMLRDGNTYRFITDQVGSPRFLIDTGTNLVQSIYYDEFGAVLADTAPGFQPFGFAGGLYDADTRLVRFGARDYDPQTGRWTTKDPIGFGGGDSDLYAYAENNPVNLIDPSGLDAITADPHALSAMAALFRRSLSDPNGSEWTAVFYKGGDSKIYCKSLGSSRSANSNSTSIPKGLPNEFFAHTHPRGRTERADDPGDVIAANQVNMTSYVLSAAGIHKLVPNGHNGGTETTEIDNRTYLRTNGHNWYDYKDQDSCGCAGLN